MRITELSRNSGIPVPTIKYYVREGLLDPGELTSPNQAEYGDSHLRRLKLIRILADVGGLSIAAIRHLLVVGSPTISHHDGQGKAKYSAMPRYDYPASDASQQAAARQAGELIGRRGWRIKPNSAALELLIIVLAALRDLGQDLVPLAEAYAEPAEQIAGAELTAILRHQVDDQFEAVIVGTALGDTLLVALRRLAEESMSAGEGVDWGSADPRPKP